MQRKAFNSHFLPSLSLHLSLSLPHVYYYSLHCEHVHVFRQSCFLNASIIQSISYLKTCVDRPFCLVFHSVLPSLTDHYSFMLSPSLSSFPQAISFISNFIHLFVFTFFLLLSPSFSLLPSFPSLSCILLLLFLVFYLYRSSTSCLLTCELFCEFKLH